MSLDAIWLYQPKDWSSFFTSIEEVDYYSPINMLFMGFFFWLKLSIPMFPMMFIEFPMVSSIKLCIAFIIFVVKQMVSALEIASLDGCKGLQSLTNIPSTHQDVATYFTRYFTRSKMPINKSKIT
jgi:hypothetical protein